MNFKIISDFIVSKLGLFLKLTAKLHSSQGERTYLVSFEVISRIENQFYLRQWVSSKNTGSGESF
jgi:hypothetical protein